jgi:hypothetical protein
MRIDVVAAEIWAMKRWLMVVVMVMLAVGWQAAAQDDAGAWRLRVPTVVEYVEAIPDFEALYAENGYRIREYLLPLIEAEFRYRYWEDIDYATLTAAFDKLKFRFEVTTWGPTIPAIDYDPWIARIVQGWLDGNRDHVYMRESSVWRFDDFVILIEQRDFNGDRSLERVLNVVKGLDHTEYHNYLILPNVSRDPIITVPLPYRAYGYDQYSSRTNPAFEKSFADITADGRSEWILQTADFGGRLGILWESVSTYVLYWHDGSIVERIPDRLDSITIITPPSVDPVFANIDDDPALEISTSFIHADNWGCGYQEITIYDWDGEAFVKLEPRYEALDCTARHAEEAMWAGDFETAAELYALFIDTYEPDYQAYQDCINQPGDPYCEWALTVEIFQYFMARRVVAYALAGDTQKVQASLDALDEYDLGFLRDMLIEGGEDKRAICQAAYDWWDSRFIQENRSDFVFAPGIVLEGINDDTFQQPRILPGEFIFTDPNLAGCDMRLLDGISTPVPTILPTLEPTFAPDSRSIQDQWIAFENAYRLFINGDYETTLQIAQNASPEDEFDTFYWRYWRALALEALERPDEALAEYVAIYEAAPESAWGLLAGLHIERVT